MYMKPSTRRALNVALGSILGPTYFQHIPIQEIITMINNAGYTLVQEDGTPWEGILTGREGRAQFSLAITDGMLPIANSTLLLHWYAMPSENTEVTGYFT